MQVTVNSTNIVTFGFSITFDVANQSVIFNIASLTEFNGSGGTLIQGINFSLNDASNNPLIPGNSGSGTWDWDNPNILVPSTDMNPDYAGESTFTVDLSAVWGNNYTVLFQNYKISGAIKDENGTVYETAILYQKVCQPKGLTNLGYILGEMTLKPDCPNGFLTVKEVTNLSYDSKLPNVQSSTGELFYPRGTVDGPTWTDAFSSGIAFTNNVVYTGNYKILNTTTASYYYDQDFIVQLEYYTSSERYDITCEKHMLSIMCCITDFEIYKNRYCTGNEAAALQAKWNEAGTYLAIGLGRESAGRDSSEQAAKIRKILNCNCGDSALRQIAPDPVNPLVYSIVVEGIHGTDVVPTVVGNTKTFTVDSDVYQVSKITPSDTAFTIQTITSTPGIVVYKIGFNYEVLASTLLTTISGNQTLINQFNGLIEFTDINGKCIYDIGASNYFLAQKIASADAVWTSVIIGSTTYTAPADLLASDTAGAISWLNGLGVGIYTVSYSTDGVSFFVNVLSANNTYQPVSALFGSTTSLFQKTTMSLKAFAQAVIDYVCEQSAVDIPTGETVTVCTVDYNGNVTETEYDTVTPISDLLIALASVGCDIAEWVKASVITGARNGIYKTVDGSGLPEFRLGTNPLIENTTIDGTDFWVYIKNIMAIGPNPPSIVDDGAQLTVRRNGVKGRQAITGNLSLESNADNTSTNYVTAGVQGQLSIYIFDGVLNISSSIIMAGLVGRIIGVLYNDINGSISGLYGGAILGNGIVDSTNNIEELNAIYAATPLQNSIEDNYTGTISEVAGVRIAPQQGGLPFATQTTTYGLIQEGEDDLNLFNGQVNLQKTLDNGSFANNAAALSGGLVAGDVYYTDTAGEYILKIAH